MNRWRTLLNFVLVQIVIFGQVFRLAAPGTVVYINSLLPAAAALAAKCRGARVVYHLHEVSIRPTLLKRLLCAVANLTAYVDPLGVSHVFTIFPCLITPVVSLLKGTS